MNPGQLIATLGFGQLVIALYFDRKFAAVETPMFKAAVENYDGLGMKQWFTEQQLGKTRSSEVLRLARLPTSARQVLVALFVSFIAGGVTFFIVLEEHEHPNWRTLRLGCTGAVAIACFLFGISLLVHIIKQDLSDTAKSHSEYRNDRQQKTGIARWYARVRSLETLTPYLTVAFLGSTVTIVTAVGL